MVLTLVATFGLTVVLFVYASRREDEAVHRVFEDRAQTLASAVRVSCESHLEVLFGLQSLFSSFRAIGEEEFDRFVTPALHRHPGIRGLSWNPRVTAAGRERFEAETGSPIIQLDAQGRLVPAVSQPEYVVVRYIAPTEHRKTLGSLDVSSEPVRREALSRARDTGQVAATGRILLASEPSATAAVLVFAPVYGVGETPANPAERRQEIRGYVTGAFRLGELVEIAVQDLPRDGVAVALFDLRDPGKPGLLYADARWPNRVAEPHGPREQPEPFDLGGRRWEVRVAATDDFLETYQTRRAWLVLLGGCLFTGLLGAFLFMITSRTTRIEELVVRRTAELQTELQERQRAEGEVRVSEARNRALLEHMIAGMVAFDGRSRIESVNPAAERILGYPEQELVGRSVTVLAAETLASPVEAFLRQAHRDSIGRLTEWWARRKDGKLIQVEVALFKFMTPEGPRYAANFQDISERREVDRLKSEFVSTVSHELRTPLTSIRGSLGLLAGGAVGDLPPHLRELIRLAERNVVRLTALINDILDFERLDSGRVQLQRAEMDLQPLFEQSLEAVHPMADEQRVALVCTSVAVRLLVDADRIVQVLINLLSNAVKFSPPGREVRLWSEETGGGWVRIFVQDQGPGVPEGYQQRIFERFARVETADHRDKGGTGLGLAICKMIVEQHGGRIGVDSTPGDGSTFWFDLPGAESRAAATQI